MCKTLRCIRCEKVCEKNVLHREKSSVLYLREKKAVNHNYTEYQCRPIQMVLFLIFAGLRINLGVKGNVDIILKTMTFLVFFLTSTDILAK